MSLYKIEDVENLWEGEMRRVSLGHTFAVVMKVEGQTLAYLDRCVHLGFALSKGCLQGRTLQCAAHHWLFDAVTGEGVNPKSARLRPLAVVKKSDQFYIEFQDGDQS